MKKCSDCHCTWDENNEPDYTACPSCGSEAIRTVYHRSLFGAIFARIWAAFIPAIIAIGLIISLGMYSPLLEALILLAIITPIYLIAWALYYFRYRFGPAKGHLVKRSILIIVTVVGLTLINYGIGFAGCASAYSGI